MEATLVRPLEVVLIQLVVASDPWSLEGFANPSSFLAGLLDDTCERYSSKLSSRPSRYDALTLLSRLSERERQNLYETFFQTRPGSTSRSPAVALWELGKSFRHVGRYGLAVGAFLQAAFSRDASNILNAIALIEAGSAATSGGFGELADFCLTNANQILATGRGATDGTDDDRAAYQLARFLRYFSIARREISRDAPDEANRSLDQAVGALNLLPGGLQQRFGISCSVDHVPDVLLLRARIERRHLEILKIGRPTDIEDLLAKADERRGETVVYGRPLFDHCLHFQYASLYRLEGKWDSALEHVEKAIEQLKTAETETGKNLGNGIRNTRRRGFAATLEGEIHADRGDHNRARGCLERAIEFWGEINFSSGLSRAKRDLALCHMAIGQNWSRSSSLLTEAVALAASSADRGAEARALAAKVGFHRTLGHESRADELEAKLAAILTKHDGPIDRAIDSLKQRKIRPCLRRPELEHVRSQVRALGLLGDSPKFFEMLREAQRVAVLDGPVVLRGERGTEKDKVAKLIHALSPDRTGPFLAVCRVDLGQDLSPWLEGAERGTLFVANLDDMSRADQAALLRALQGPERHARALRSAADVRLIVGARTPLADLRQQGQLLEGLYDRIGADQVEREIIVPPLRERRADIVLIGCEYFRQAVQERFPDHQSPTVSLSTGAWDFITRKDYEWSNNLDELRGVMQAIATQLAGPGGRMVQLPASGEVMLESLADLSRFTKQPAAVRVLSTEIPITPRDLEEICARHRLESVVALADHLKEQYPNYRRNRESLVRLMRRHPVFKKVLEQVFGRRRRNRTIMAAR